MKEIQGIEYFNDKLESFSYLCAGCGNGVHGRIIAKATYNEDGIQLAGFVFWCLCPCSEPTVITVQTSPTQRMHQSPRPTEYSPGTNWPQDLERLFREAAAAFSAEAFTACAMVCRKILMAVACKHGDQEGKSFASYVGYILSNVVPIPGARDSIDAIRQIGNEANHDVAFVSETEARRALRISTYVLNAAYSLPLA